MRPRECRNDSGQHDWSRYWQPWSYPLKAWEPEPQINRPRIQKFKGCVKCGAKWIEGVRDCGRVIVQTR